MNRVNTVLVAMLSLAGCSAGRVSQSVIPPAVIECSHVDPKTGDLIALWMTRTEGTPKSELAPVLVPHPYAIYIHWPSLEGYPDPVDRQVFIFYDNVAKKCYQTDDYDAFLAVVANQPRGITLLQIDTCTVSRCHMPKDQWDRLEKVLAEGNRIWAVDPETRTRIMRFCYCEFLGGFVYPADKR